MEVTMELVYLMLFNSTATNTHHLYTKESTKITRPVTFMEHFHPENKPPSKYRNIELAT